MLIVLRTTLTEFATRFHIGSKMSAVFVLVCFVDVTFSLFTVVNYMGKLTNVNVHQHFINVFIVVMTTCLKSLLYEIW